MKNPITFNPGPSQLSPYILESIKEIVDSGLLSLSHRGSKFKQVCQEAVEGVKKQMQIPPSYDFFFQPSASAAMDTVLRNVVFSQSFHFVNGSFAERFYETAQQIGLSASALQTAWPEPIVWRQAQIPQDIELIAFTHNETSTGSMWPAEEIKLLRQTYPQSLIVGDVASSFGAIKMDWENADIWLGSVQKCVGLPSGLGFIIINAKAMEKAREVLKQKAGIASWQRLDVISKQMKDYQTFETPNMLDIALLAKQMQNWDIKTIEKDLLAKKKILYEAPLPWKPYIQDEKWYSSTVTNFIVDDVKKWHQTAQEAGFILGQGYGKLKDSCIRIGNFPSLSQRMTQELLDTFKTHLQ